MTGDHKRNTKGLAEFREKRAKECQERVDKTIQQLVKNKEKISFNSIAERSNVSKKYLYDHYFDRINTLRNQQAGLSSPKQVKREMSDANKDVIIEAQSKRIKDLEKEIKNLKSILEKRYGDEY
ncbi:DUF6262 family protein [Acetobacterium wieringae]|uniref:DUF6262 family protein n=1 Tax=Acetobacterium wieringae TaxID=52694 RepID=UPI00203385E7|nr:DUF6262 family protein [Acetobacterium wieringae]URN84967.1 DUF6262 family protein [Acetobacterium wieringae]